jgi:hypothetical protein
MSGCSTRAVGEVGEEVLYATGDDGMSEGLEHDALSAEHESARGTGSGREYLLWVVCAAGVQWDGSGSGRVGRCE